MASANHKEEPVRRLHRAHVVAAVAALSLAPFVPAQDLTIISKVTKDGGAPETTTSYMTAERIRMNQGDGREAIVDYKAGQMISIDNNKKTYSVITQKDLDSMAAQMQEKMNSPEMKKMREQIKDLPPEQRRALENMGAGMFEVEKVGTSRKIAGYSCENWTVKMGGFSRSEECLTTELKFPTQPYEMYKRYAETMRSLMASMSMMGVDFDKMTEEFKKMRGYALANRTTVDIMGHRSVTDREVVEIKRAAIPASVFDIPAGYTKVENSMSKGL